MNFVSMKNKLLKPEEVYEKVAYSITLNPIDKLQCYSQNSTRRLTTFYEFHYKYLKKILAPFADYDLWLEISSKGRLHFHGIIYIKDIISFYLSSVPKLTDDYAIEMDTIDDVLIWLSYCQKQSVIREIIPAECCYMSNIERLNKEKGIIDFYNIQSNNN